MPHPDLDPVPDRLGPLLQALGRAVLGAAVLERVLLLDIANRRAGAEGLSEQLARDLAELESHPGGRLLGALRGLGIEAEQAERIEDVIRRRNWVVHHLMEERDVARAFMTGDGIEGVVDRLDALAADCQAVINSLAPAAFTGLETALGKTLPELLELARTTDLDAIQDDKLREQLRWVRTIAPDELDR